MRLIIIGLILSILFSLMASAASFEITNIDVNTMFRTEGNIANITLKNNINSALTLNGKITVNKDGLFTDNQLSLGSVNLEASETKTFVLPIDISKNAVLGSYSANFTFVNINDATDNTLINKNIKVEDRKLLVNGLDRCENDITGDLVIKIEDPDDGEDFNPGDQIKIRIKVENTGDKDIDVQVEAILFNVDERDDLVRSKSEVKEVRDGTKEEFEFSLIVPTTEIDEGDEFILFLKAIEDPDKERLNCQEEFSVVDLRRRFSDVVIKRLGITPSNVNCGDVLSARVDVENIGRRDQDVTVKIKSDLLGISDVAQQFKLKDADADEKDPKNEAVVNFDVKIPTDAKPGNYLMESEVVFDGSSHVVSKSFGVNCDGKIVKEITKLTSVKINFNLLERNIEVMEGGSFSLPIKVKNNENVKSVVEINADVSGFGELINNGNTIVLNPFEERTVYLFVNVNKVGKFNGVVDILNNGNLINSEVFNVDIKGVERLGLNPNLIVGIVIVLIVIILLIIGLNRKI